MAPLNIEHGFDLRHIRNYATAEGAIKSVEKNLAGVRGAGVVFNVIIVEQTVEIEANLKSVLSLGATPPTAQIRTSRYIAMLYCFRAPANYPGGDTQAMIDASRAGFPTFR